MAENRRSIRTYQPGPIPREDIEELIRLAGRAPSAWNLQPWRVVAVSDASTKDRLQQAAFKQPQVGRAPVVLVIYSDMAATLGHLDEVLSPALSADARERLAARIQGRFSALEAAAAESWGVAQVGIFLGYLLLLIEAFGYSSSPMLGFQPAEVKAILGLPASVEIAALVAVGTAAEDGALSARRPLETVLRWV